MGISLRPSRTHSFLDGPQTLAETESRLPLHARHMVGIKHLKHLNLFSHFSQVITSAGFASALTLLSPHTSWSPMYPNGGYGHVIRSGLTSTIIFWPPLLMEARRWEIWCCYPYLWINHELMFTVLQIMVFILTFSVQGASGNAHLFPQWYVALLCSQPSRDSCWAHLFLPDRWGANQAGVYLVCQVTFQWRLIWASNSGNYDRCAYINTSS